MLITVPQLWVNLTPEHHDRLLAALILICQELLRSPQAGPQCEVPHD